VSHGNCHDLHLSSLNRAELASSQLELESMDAEKEVQSHLLLLML
jgi:hypothetical protein